MTVRMHSARLHETTTELRNGELIPVDYVDNLCDRIDVNDGELQSLVCECDRRERLIQDANVVCDRFSEPSARPPLYGVPVGVKDIIHVDGFETRAGTAVPPELFDGPEASCVTRLRDAGAVILGKTVTTEFAGAAPGPTRNPHDLGHTPGGSSSGSAAAVAAGLCPLALGTQTGGSVIRPAAYCGIVGMKPSFKRIPRDGVIPRSTSADHVGMFTQDVVGMRIAASVLCNDWSTADGPADDPPTIGIPEGAYLENATDQALGLFETQLTELEGAGCEVKRVDVPTFVEFDALNQRHHRLCNAELAIVHQEWFDEYEAFYRTPMVEKIEAGREVTAVQLAECRDSRIDLRNELTELMEQHGLDVWASPPAQSTAPETITSTGDSIMNRPWTHSGLPVVTVPAGVAENGLPVGIQFTGGFMADEELLVWAEALAEAL